MKRKLLLAGPNSIHLNRYYHMIKEDMSEVHVVTTKAAHDFFANESNVHYVDFSMKNPLTLNTAVKKIKGVLATFQPDLIHTHQANTSSLSTVIAANIMKVPVILTAWGSDVLLLPQAGLIFKKMVQFILRHSTVITSDSVFMAGKIQQLLDGKKTEIRIANFGIGITPEKQAAKENMIYSNRGHKDLYRIDEVIMQFYQFQLEQTESWTLVIAGEGENTPALKELAVKLGIADRVEFVGWIGEEENSYYYNKAKMYITIPISDGTSISLLEAMACGCIPIVSDIPANYEWVLDGVNGVFFTDYKVGSVIAEALQLDGDMVQTINQKLIEEKGTVAANRQKFVEIYHQV